MKLQNHLFVASLLLLLASCGPSGSFNYANASGHYVSSNVQCAPYAREVSGLRLYGDAGDWWYAAANHYRRGQTPATGAVLVLKKTRHLRSGHVAVVKSILGPRAITVTHSNWGNNSSNRRIIYDSMLAEDASPANNWTLVRFWNVEHNVLGNPYPAFGFIYP